MLNWLLGLGPYQGPYQWTRAQKFVIASACGILGLAGVIGAGTLIVCMVLHPRAAIVGAVLALAAILGETLYDAYKRWAYWYRYR